MRNFLGTAQTVTATEKWLAAVQAGQAFFRGALVTPAAAQFAECQLINPGGATVTVLVRMALTWVNGAANAVDIRRFDTNLATDVGAGINLLTGGAAGQAHVRSAIPAALDGTFNASFIATNVSSTNAFPDWAFSLAPGQGILLANENAQVNMNVLWFWMES